MRVFADAGKSELAHVGAAKEQQAGGAQRCDDSGVGIFDFGVMPAYHRSGQGFFITNIEQVLECDRDTGKWWEYLRFLARTVDRVGEADQPGVNRGKHRLRSMCALQRALHQFAGAGLPAA